METLGKVAVQAQNLKPIRVTLMSQPPIDRLPCQSPSMITTLVVQMVNRQALVMGLLTTLAGHPTIRIESIQFALEVAFPLFRLLPQSLF
jgi:hypothetical protein